MAGKGMTTVAGRVRRDPILDLKFGCAFTNTIFAARRVRVDLMPSCW